MINENKSMVNIESIKPTLEKIHALEKELQTHIRGRDVLIHKIVLSLMCNENIMILGKHGEAKGLIVDMLCRATNLTYYKKQLHNETQLKEIIGLLNPIAYKEGRLELLKTPFWNSNILFFDEFLRGRSEFLDFLLEVMQERKTSKGYQGEVDLPLVSVICVTNPTTEEYNTERPDHALLDRFIMIDTVGHLIQESRECFEQALEDDNLILEDYTIKKIDLNYEDFRKLREAVKGIKVEIPIIKNIACKLSDMGYNFSTRFCKKAKLLVKAEALFNGRATAQNPDYIALSCAFNNRFEDLTEDKINNAIDEGIISIEYSDNLNKIRQIIKIQEPMVRIEKAIEVYEKTKEQYNELPETLQRAITDLGKLLKQDIRANLKEIPPELIDMLDTEAFKSVVEDYRIAHKIETRYLNEKELEQFNKWVKPLIKYCEVTEQKMESERKFVILPKINKLKESIAEQKGIREALEKKELKSMY